MRSRLLAAAVAGVGAFGLVGAALNGSPASAALYTDVVARIDSGATTGHTDPDGRAWSADRAFTGGVASQEPVTPTLTDDPGLYRSQRLTSPTGTGFSYAVPVPTAGTYLLRLHYAEGYYTAAGSRVQSAAAEGTPVVSGLDVAAAPGKGRPYVAEVPVRVTDGTLNVSLTQSRDRAALAAIEVLGQAVTPTPTATPSPTPSPTASPTPTVTYPAGWRPFTDDGPWNRPIPANPVIDPGSAAMVANLKGDAHPIIASLYDYGTKIYEATADTPKATINCTMDWGVCGLERYPVPIPQGATANPGDDAWLHVVDRQAGKAWCLWQYRNDRATASWGGVYDLNGPGDGLARGDYDKECSGSGMPSTGPGGAVRLEEAKALHIPHALTVATRFCQAPNNIYRYPAGKSDGKFSGAGAIPEGARVQLDPALNVDALPNAKPIEKAVARALQRYGAYITDCGGANFSIGFEHPRSGPDPYPGLGMGWDYWGFTNVPADRLRVLRAWDGS